MARMEKGMRGVVLGGLLLVALAVSGCSAKNGGDQPPPKGGCRLWVMEIFG